MHTFRRENEVDDLGRAVDVYVHHNGDYSGDARVIVIDRATGVARELPVPCSALVAFTLDAVTGRLQDLVDDLVRRAT